MLWYEIVALVIGAAILIVPVVYLWYTANNDNDFLIGGK